MLYVFEADVVLPLIVDQVIVDASSTGHPFLDIVLMVAQLPWEQAVKVQIFLSRL